MLLFDWTFILLIPAIILAIYAQSKVSSTYQKYRRIKASSGRTGAEVARGILDRNGLHNVDIKVIPGRLSDHYNPRTRNLSLSEDIYYGRSVSAVGIAAHEVGHAIQHAKNYSPLAFRNGFFPVASFGSKLAFPLFIIGLFMRIPSLMDIGILFFSAAVIFQLITLPVEFNASSRALKQLNDGGYLIGSEVRYAREVLNAAALTYLAATLMAVLQLVRLLALRER